MTLENNGLDDSNLALILKSIVKIKSIKVISNQIGEVSTRYLCSLLSKEFP